MTTFQLIETELQLDNLIKSLQHKNLLAIDLECENNLHHYGAYISLVQISDGQEVWIIDVLKLKSIQPLLELLTNRNTQKVFHDVNFDLRIIHTQWQCSVVNLFDTQLAAMFLGEEKLGLGSLLEKHFNLKTEKRFQRVDWTKRPLSNDKLQYAANDVAHLLKLKQILEIKLIKKNRLSWVLEECQSLENLNWDYKEQSYLDLPGAKSLEPREQAILQALFTARKELAKRADKPPFMIFSNRQLIAFSKHLPINWLLVKGVHPIVNETTNYLKQITTITLNSSESQKKEVKPKLKPQQYQWTKELLELRNQLGNQLAIKGHLILSNEQVKNLAVTQSWHHLRNWQRELIKNHPLVLSILGETLRDS